MPVYLTAILTLGLYLCAVPVKFALILRVEERLRFGAGGALFEGRFALRRARLRASGQRRHLPWRRAALDLEKFQAAAALARRLLRGTRLEQLRVSGRVGLPDAAQTALVVGLARSAEAALAAVLAPGAVRLELEPDFSGGGCALTAWCMFSISAGQIIRGALQSAGERASESISRFLSESPLRRVHEWTGTPLKTSCAPPWRTSGTWWMSTRSSATPSSPRTARR